VIDKAGNLQKECLTFRASRDGCQIEGARAVRRQGQTPTQETNCSALENGSRESAGLNLSRRSPKGNRCLRLLHARIAWAAIHTEDTFFVPQSTANLEREGGLRLALHLA
jgi:hypothetical protein